MRTLVTGGSGFIGSNLTRRLLELNHEVRVMGNLSTGRKQNLEEIMKDIEFIKADIRDMEAVKKSVKGMDYVFHEAALPSVPRSIEDPVTTNEVNVTGTLNVLRAAQKAGVKRLVYASSSSVYGDSPTLPKKETMTPNPISPYAVSKLVGEYYCTVFHKAYGLEAISLRYFNVYGPRQNPDSEYAAVIPKFITSALSNRPLEIHGNGEQTRDFSYVDDVVQANILSLTAKKAPGEVINISYGDRISLNELVELLNKLLGKNLKPVYTDPRPGDVKHSLADISKARELLGYEPKHDVESGLRKTIEWFSA